MTPDCMCEICGKQTAKSPALPASSPVEARDGGPGTPVPGSPLKPGGSPIAEGKARRLISST